MHTILKSAIALIIPAALALSSPAIAGGNKSYQVTITNMTHSINFTPIMVVSSRHPISIYEAGSPASDELAAVAEGGDLVPFTTLLNSNPHVVDLQNSGGLLAPGASVTVIVDASHGARYISLASMMLPTNDGFIALNSVRAPRYGSKLYFSPGLDAGSEPNDESCANIPGPTCGGVGPSPGVDPDDEGYVHVHRGTHGIGDLVSNVHDWRNPVARIQVTRVRDH